MKDFSTLVEEIRSRVDIVSVVGQYVKLRKAGRNFKGLCPFHDDSDPSFSVSSERQIFHCFGCQKGGDVFTFIREVEGFTFIEALRFFGQQVGVEIPDRIGESPTGKREKEQVLEALRTAHSRFRTALTRGDGKVVREYLLQRNIPPAIIDRYQLGWAPPSYDDLTAALTRRGFSSDILDKAGLVSRRADGSCYDRFRGRIICSIRTLMGAVIAFSGRVLDDSEPKYLNSPETLVFNKGNQLFGLYEAREAIRKQDNAILVEGNFDVLSLQAAGFDTVVAPLGTALTPRQLRLIRRFTKNLLLLFDADPAGRKAAERGVILALENELPGIRVVTLDGAKDPDEMIQLENGVNRLRAAIRNAVPGLDFLIACVAQRHDLNNPSGRADAGQEMIEMLSRFPNRIYRNEAATFAARKLRISPEILLRELHPGSGRVHTSRRLPLNFQGAEALERTLLWLVLNHRELVPVLLEEVDCQEFETPVLQEIVKAMAKLSGEGRVVEFSQLQRCIESDQARNMLVRLSFPEMNELDIGNLQISETFDGCITRFLERRQLRECREIQDRLAQSQEGEVNDLLRRKQEEMRRRDRMHRKCADDA